MDEIDFDEIKMASFCHANKMEKVSIWYVLDICSTTYTKDINYKHQSNKPIELKIE